MSSFPPDTEAQLPQPAVPIAPLDPTLGAKTGVSQADIVNPEDECTWLESILASRLTLPSDHPLQKLREAADKCVNDLDIPGRKTESWRFTQLRSVYASRYVAAMSALHKQFSVSDMRHYVPDTAGIVLVFVDGMFSKDLSLLNDDSGSEWTEAGGFFGSVTDYKGDISRLTTMFTEQELGSKDGGLFPTVGHAISADAAVLHIPAGFSVSRPVAILNLHSGGPQQGLATACAPRLAIIAEERSKVVLLESHASLDDSYGLILSGSTIFVDQKASVSHYLINDCGNDTHFIGNVHAAVLKNGAYEVRPISLGGSLGRFTIGVDLKEEEAHSLVHGAIVGFGDQVHDLHSRICHDAQSSTSNQLQKNIATDRSRAVFNGKIIVTTNGDQTDADQLCRSLLLSDRAGVDAMPVLEIETDDVKCTHGATVADLEDDEVFYCQSRGLTLEQAQFLIVTGFAKEVLGDCPFPTVLEQVSKRVDFIASSRLERVSNYEQLSSI
ncbi:hypothetical protein BWQ96_04772 [Gracilariopsis chorda]|uniref:Iron-sulfur cluster assembly SufBD family protein ycf24 n=1 Tax=Gracilariopsis chorda TaxID=448386 RepID=A0A2V3ITN7_9FLOR|nr:hypothetical protein BWQ96_04772 [Gracilariopsis chorda]|eukprot:PXF45474.1 hypothetical protein BWQ96_04772 [Gracilariopsis chorda]